MGLKDEEIKQLADILSKQISKEIFKNKYAPALDVLKLVGAGLFLSSTFISPNVARLSKFSFNQEEKYAWKRFNIPYLKRTLQRLESRKLIEISSQNNFEVIKLSQNGKELLLKESLDNLRVEKPLVWNKTWWLIGYDIPKYKTKQRNIFRNYLTAWGFYPLQDSLFLHAYPCVKQIRFIREYLNIGQFVRIFEVLQIENTDSLKEFFGV